MRVSLRRVTLFTGVVMLVTLDRVFSEKEGGGYGLVAFWSRE